MLHDGACRDVVQALTLQAVSIDDAAQGGGEHFLISNLCIGAVAAREWNAYAADDGDASRSGSDQHTYTSSNVTTRDRKLQIMNPPTGL